MSAVISDVEFAPIANSAKEWREAMAEMAKRKTPSFFHIRAKLPRQGRTNQVLGASTYMNVVLKTYASGGENEIHAHTNEDHVFVVLQAARRFLAPAEKRSVLGATTACSFRRVHSIRFTQMRRSRS